MDKFVIAHPEDGIFLGEFWGLGFWSKLDRAGQEHAPAFDREEEARAFVASWSTRGDPDLYSFHAVGLGETAEYATVEQLVEAGLEDHLGQLAGLLDKGTPDLWDRLDDGTYWQPLAPRTPEEYLTGETEAVFVWEDHGSWRVSVEEGGRSRQFASLPEAFRAGQHIIDEGYAEMDGIIAASLGVDAIRWSLLAKNGVISLVSKEDPRVAIYGSAATPHWSFEFDADGMNDTTVIENSNSFEAMMAMAEEKLAELSARSFPTR